MAVKYDAVVVGAGVAGLSFATRMAGYGYRVVVLESANPENLGHDWWDTIELRSFDVLGLARPEPPEARTPFTFKMNVLGRTYPVVARMPDDMVNVERRLLATRMVRWATQADVEIRFGCHVTGPILENGRCKGVTLATAGDHAARVKAPLTIDASGAAAVLRRRFDPAVAARWGFETEIPPESFMHTWRGIATDTSVGGDSVICMGQGNSTSWISREPDGLVDIFAGSLGGSRGAEDPETVAMDMIARQGGIGDWVRPGTSAVIPLRRPFDGIVAPGFMLLGDSACMANPINGSGMTVAIDAAIIAADTAHDAMMKGRFEASDLWSYPRDFFRANAELAFLDALKSFVFSAPRDPMLDFFRQGGLRGPAFWKMRPEFGPAGFAAKAGAFARTKGAAALLPPMAGTLTRAAIAERHMALYPSSPSGFNQWKAMRRRITG